MEAQLHRQYGHNYEDPLNTGLHSEAQDEGEQHQEKKSVLKKVKAKAKKLKDKITATQGHGGHDEQEHEHHYSSTDHEEHEGDEDDEMEEDPAVHDSSGSTPAGGEGVNLEKPTAVGEDRYSREMKEPASGSGYVSGRPRATDEADAQEPEGPYLTDITGRKVLGPNKEHEGMQQQGVKIGEPEGLEKDDQVDFPPSNYQTKTIDPTGKGGEEADVAPLVRSFEKTGIHDESDVHNDESAPKVAALVQSFNKMDVHDESASKEEEEPFQSDYTGSHDQFAPEPRSTVTNGDNPESIPKTYDPSKPEELPQDTMTGKGSEQGSYIGKIATVPSVIADKAMAAKNVVASKLGYGGAEGAKAKETGESEVTAKSASPRGYVQGVAAKVAGTLAPVYTKVADTGSSVITRVKGAGGKEEASETPKEGAGEVADKGISVKEYLSEKFKPGEEDKALSREISDALHKRKENLVSKSGGKVIDETEGQSRTLAEANREGDDVKGAGDEGLNKGVVGKLKDAVSSWVGKAGQQQPSQGSPDSYTGDEGSPMGEIGHAQTVSDDKKVN